jgi:hypothetical protein
MFLYESCRFLSSAAGNASSGILIFVKILIDLYCGSELFWSLFKIAESGQVLVVMPIILPTREAEIVGS